MAEAALLSHREEAHSERKWRCVAEKERWLMKEECPSADSEARPQTTVRRQQRDDTS